MKFQKFANEYIKSLKADLDRLDLEMLEKITELIWQTYKNNKTLYLIGNGGSAATASHMANDFSKGLLGHKGDVPVKPMKAVALTDNFSLISAWANDTSFEDVFSRQIECLAEKGDLLIVFSASGNSPNILKAVKTAKKKGLKTIGFCGFDGGKLKKMADLSLVVYDNHYGRAEDAHLIFCHIISNFLYEKLKES